MFEERPEHPPDRPLDPTARITREPPSERGEADYELVEEVEPAGKDGSRQRKPRRKQRRPRKGGRLEKGTTVSGNKTAPVLALVLGAAMIVLAFVMLGVGIGGGSVASGVALMVFFLLLGAIASAGGIYLLYRNLRLVFGRTGVQLVQNRNDVIGQIPYDNIVLFQVTYEHVWHLGAEEPEIREHFDITLGDRKRKDTWWTSSYPRDEEYDIRVTNAIKLSPTYLQLLLKNAMRGAGFDVGLA